MKVRVTQEAFYGGTLRAVGEELDYKGEKAPAWAKPVKEEKATKPVKEEKAEATTLSQMQAEEAKKKNPDAKTLSAMQGK